MNEENENNNSFNSGPADNEMKPSIESPKPKKNMNKKLISLVSLLFLLGLVFGGGYYTNTLLNEDESSNSENAQNSTSEIPQPVEEEKEIASKLTEYSNEKYGFKFSYPSSWGEVTENDEPEEEGTRIIGTFTEQKDISFGSSTKDFQPFGRDGGCSMTIVGVRNDSKLSDIITEETDEVYRDESVDKPSDYRTITGPIFTSETVAIGSSFQGGQVSGLGACPGFKAEAMVLFPETAVTNGVIFTFNTKENFTGGVPLEWAEDYKSNPGYYYDTNALDEYVETVKSVSSL
jgi:hypothetical protein